MTIHCFILRTNNHSQAKQNTSIKFYNILTYKKVIVPLLLATAITIKSHYKRKPTSICASDKNFLRVLAKPLEFK